MNNRMNIITLAITCLYLAVCHGETFDFKQDELSAKALASFLKINHKSFTLKHNKPRTTLYYIFKIYKDGKEYMSHQNASIAQELEKFKIDKKQIGCYSGTYGISRNIEYKIKSDKFSILFKNEESNYLNIQVILNGIPHTHSILKPAESKFPIFQGGTFFDKQGRLILAFDVPVNDKNDKAVRYPLYIKDTSWALVFEVNTE